MEGFEEFRKKTAEAVKSVPKSARGEVLKAIKKEDPEKYKKAKELKRAKSSVLFLSRTEDLVNPENVGEVATWIKTELKDYTDTEDPDFYQRHHLRDSQINEYHLQSLLGEITLYLAKRLQIKTGDLNTESIAKSSDPIIIPNKKYPNRRIEAGSMDLMGEKIFDYYTYCSGNNLDYTGSIQIGTWYDANLKTAVSKLIEHLKTLEQR